MISLVMHSQVLALESDLSLFFIYLLLFHSTEKMHWKPLLSSAKGLNYITLTYSKCHVTVACRKVEVLSCQHSMNKSHIVLLWNLIHNYHIVRSTINRDHEGLGILAQNYHPKPAWYLLSDILGALVRLNQAQKCLQINPKPFHLIVMIMKF